MKLVMDEKLKHRVIGLAVVISLGAIFAPAVMRKSNQPADNFSVNVKLPPKPVLPTVSAADEQDMFKTIKVARVNVPSVPEEKQLPEIVRAERIKSDQVLTTHQVDEAKAKPDTKPAPVQVALNESAKATVSQVTQVAANTQPNPMAQPDSVAPRAAALTAKILKKAPQVAKVTTKQPIKKEVYAVQLASFAQVGNAQALVSRLKSKGYKANVVKTATAQGPVYKVLAGHSANKNEALRLKSQLASSMQLNGFVVNAGVS